MSAGSKPESSNVTTAVQPEIPAGQQALFVDVLRLLEAYRLRYVVSGAFAMREHTGICRETKDLDLFLPAEHVPQTLAVLKKQGFRCEVCDPVWLAKAHRGDFFIDLITGMSNAAIVVDESWIDRSYPAVVFDVPTRVLAPEELIASKLFVSRRERFDGADIAHIIYGTHGKLDWDRLLQLTGDHWEVLLWSLVLFRYVYPGQTDYVPRPLWDDLLGRFTQAVRHPDPRAPFRGSLVDENMFAIDLRDWGLENILQKNREHRLAELGELSKVFCDPNAVPSEDAVR
ncbi:MAG: nucleotidyltransferase [Acidobacteriales bacterium]|nr:nucleotidyltransferase [Terriglobales bacterium]